MKTRFDLEQEIMQCWNIVDDIKTIYTYHLDKRELTEDEMGNILIGLEKLYQIKFETLFDTFEECLRKNEFNQDLFNSALEKVRNEQSKTREDEVSFNEGNKLDLGRDRSAVFSD
jgi:hypothetical protein